MTKRNKIKPEIVDRFGMPFEVLTEEEQKLKDQVTEDIVGFYDEFLNEAESLGIQIPGNSRTFLLDYQVDNFTLRGLETNFREFVEIVIEFCEDHLRFWTDGEEKILRQVAEEWDEKLPTFLASIGL